MSYVGLSVDSTCGIGVVLDAHDSVIRHALLCTASNYDSDDSGHSPGSDHHTPAVTVLE